MILTLIFLILSLPHCLNSLNDQTGVHEGRVIFVKYECVKESCERCFGSGCSEEKQFSTLTECQTECQPPRCLLGHLWVEEELEDFDKFGGFRSCEKQGSRLCQQACEDAHNGQQAVGTCTNGMQDMCTCQFCGLPDDQSKCSEHQLQFLPGIEETSHKCVLHLEEAHEHCWHECENKHGDNLARAACDESGCNCAICDLNVKRYFCTTSNRCDECNFQKDCPEYTRLFQTRSQCGEICARPEKTFQCWNNTCVPCVRPPGHKGEPGLRCRPQLTIYNNEEDCLDNCTEKCNENEELKACGSSCQPTCNDPFPKVCILRCVPGCHCKDGFIRDPTTLKCILVGECSNPVCENDTKIYKACGPACPASCDDPDPICAAGCKAGCFCPDGKVLNSQDQCVDRRECPVCGSNEIFQKCGSFCRPSCQTPVPPICTQECRSGCICKPGYIWDTSTNTCVFQTDCDEPVCAEGKIFNECGCFPSCATPVCQNEGCQAGCECEGDTLLVAGGMCMERTDPACVQTGETIP